MKNIDYKNYIVFPYTMEYLKKTFGSDVLKKYGDQLAFLYQNGYKVQNNSMSVVEEQMQLYNDFKTYEDFGDLKRMSTLSRKPTLVGIKIVDSVLEIVSRDAWALTSSADDIRSDLLVYGEGLKKSLARLNSVICSEDYEVEKVVKSYFDSKTISLFDDVMDCMDRGAEELAFVKYHSLYRAVLKIHSGLQVAQYKKADKGKTFNVKVANEQIYGAGGGFVPNTNSIKARTGSAVDELKVLCGGKMDDLFLARLRIIARESLENGEDSKVLKNFLKGDNSQIKKVADIEKQIVLSGISVLLCLKHGLNLVDTSLNNDRAEKVAKELNAICSFCGYKAKTL